MSIISGKAIEIATLVASTDNVVTNPPTGSSHTVTSLIIHDYNGAGAIVDLFLSGDAVSTGAERIEQITLGAEETAEFRPIVVPAGKYLIIQSDTSGINYHGSYTLRNGADL